MDEPDFRQWSQQANVTMQNTDCNEASLQGNCNNSGEMAGQLRELISPVPFLIPVGEKT